MIKLRGKEIRREKGITQKELADKLNMSEVGLSKSISDVGNPPLKRIGEIADVVNVPISELFEQPDTSVIVCPKRGTKLEVKEKE